MSNVTSALDVAGHLAARATLDWRVICMQTVHALAIGGEEP